jgi:hypothetical protein
MSLRTQAKDSDVQPLGHTSPYRIELASVFGYASQNAPDRVSERGARVRLIT